MSLIESGQIWENKKDVRALYLCSHKTIRIVSLNAFSDAVSSTCEYCQQWLVHSREYFLSTFTKIESSKGGTKIKSCCCDIQTIMSSGCLCGSIKRFKSK